MLGFLSDADKKLFDEDGVVVLRHVLGRHEIEGLRANVSQQMDKLGASKDAYDFSSMSNQVWNKEHKIEVGKADKYEVSVLRQMIDNDINSRPIREDVEGDDKGCFFYDVAGWREYDAIRRVAFDSRLPDICRQILGSQYLNFWEDTTFVKTPNTAQRTAFHQDYAYFQIEGNKCCIVWIPLDPVDQENGPMLYVRGSHHWNKTYAPNVFISQTPHPMSPYERCPDIESEQEKYDVISFDVDPGDVIIHHVKTIHGSRGNMSSSNPRRAVSFRYCGDDIRYFDKPGAVPQTTFDKELKNGAPLFSKDYPVVWPKPWPDFKLSDHYT